MKKFDLYRKAELVVKSVDRVSQAETAVSYVHQFKRAIKDKALSHELKMEMLRSLGKLQDSAGLDELYTLRRLINKL